MFLNPDTEVAGATLEDMVVLLGALPDAGAMGPKLFNSDFSI